MSNQAPENDQHASSAKGWNRSRRNKAYSRITGYKFFLSFTFSMADLTIEKGN
jgi:hypothetical protein